VLSPGADQFREGLKWVNNVLGLAEMIAQKQAEQLTLR
jgi:hypothetical protein